MKDSESYAALRQGFPIQVRGNKGTNYIVYPDGQLVRLDKRRPVLGHMVQGTKFVKPDYLATVIAWIKHDEEQLEKNWQCGTLSMQEHGNTDAIDARQRAVYDAFIHATVRRRRWWDLFPHVFFAVIVIGMAAVILPIMWNEMETAGLASSFSSVMGASSALWSILPIIFVIFLIGAMIQLLDKI